MAKAISTVSSEILLTIVTLTLAVPILAYFETIWSTDINERYSLTPLSCITYRYINETTVLIFNSCRKNIQIYSNFEVNTRIRVLYYNNSTNSLEETRTIYARRLHLLSADTPVTKIALNTSEGILILKK